MKKIFVWPVYILFSISLIGCTSFSGGGNTENYLATVLYFEGHPGTVVPPESRYADVKLINRTLSAFRSRGIIVRTVDITINSMVLRQTDEHMRFIQRKVDQLKEAGHTRVWLMGISAGAISVLHAGSCEVRGVEGLIVINPATGACSPRPKIDLPVLVLRHEKDGCGFMNFSAHLVDSYFSSSPCREYVLFTGGRIGYSMAALCKTQKYQHGLRGNERRFVDVVERFIRQQTASVAKVTEPTTE